MVTTEEQIPSVKLVLLGDSSVGKSSILVRYTSDTFTEGRDATIGAAFLAKIFSVEDKKIKFEIWDTAGQERFHSLAPMYYRNALVSIVVYDIKKSSSFERARNWVDELKRYGNSTMLIVLVGNKTDLDVREVSTEEASMYAQEFELLHFETSARLGTNVNELFEEIAKTVCKKELYNTKTNINQVTINKNEKNNNKCAC